MNVRSLYISEKLCQENFPIFPSTLPMELSIHKDWQKKRQGDAERRPRPIFP